MQSVLMILCLIGAVPHGIYRPGTAIFTEDGILVGPIERHTGSRISHAAIILYENGQPWVYEAALPCVRRMPLYDFQEKQKHFKRRNIKIHYVEAKQDYTQEQLDKMLVYANGQLGRKYKLRGYWKDKEVKGIHCSQFVGDVIAQSGRIRSDHWKETPVSLYTKCKEL